MTTKDIVDKIRKLEVDPNNLQNFFGTMFRAFLLDLNKQIKIRDIPVPHMIINTGDDEMWLLQKEYDYSKEPCEVTNEQYVYNIVPRCILIPGSVDSIPDQLSNPYTRGNFQVEYGDQLYTLNAEFRRMPVKFQVELQYYVNSFNDVLEIIQHMYSKFVFIRTFKFVYLGQTITASYKLPDSMSDEHQTELDGATTENRNHKITVSIELESNLPVYSPRTVVEPKYISHPISITKVGNDTIERDTAPRSGYRSFGERKHKG